MIMLDTHAWIWWASESPRIPKSALDEIEKSDVLGVSIISCWEVAMLVAKQRIGFKMDVQDWIDQALERPKVLLVQLDPQIVVLSTHLPGEFHGDPADRLIVATCLKFAFPLVTKDRGITDWRQIQIIW